MVLVPETWIQLPAYAVAEVTLPDDCVGCRTAAEYIEFLGPYKRLPGLTIRGCFRYQQQCQLISYITEATTRRT